jgi:acetyl-CoA acetyltransferase family protein
MRPVFICAGARTPIGRYGGALSTVRPDDLAAHVLKAAVARAGLDPDAVDEVWMGCANQAGEDNRNVARMATLIAGFPETIPAQTVNRLCASGLDAVIAASRAIRAGEAEVALAGGVESMSRAPFVMPKAETAFARAPEIHDTTIGWRFVNQALAERCGTDSMGETAENVAEAHGVARADQDAFAARSQARAAAAIASGRLAEEIAPVMVPQRRG